MKNILYNKLFLVLLILAILSFGLSAIFYISSLRNDIKNNSLVPIQVYPNSKQIKLNYTFNGDLPDVYDQLKVYSVIETVLNELQVNKYSQLFGFKKTPILLEDYTGTVYLFSQDNRNLYIRPKPISLEYHDFSVATASKLNQDKLLDIAADFLNKYISNNSNFSLSSPYINYKTRTDEDLLINAVTPDTAKYIEINYNYLLNQIPVINVADQNYPIQILLNWDGSIRKADITLLPNSLSLIGNADLTKPDQALTAINNNLGLIINLNNPNTPYLNLADSDMTSASFNSVELVYVYDYYTGSIQPFYRFQGYGYTKDGAKIEVGVIITALPQDLYQK